MISLGIVLALLITAAVIFFQLRSWREANVLKKRFADIFEISTKYIAKNEDGSVVVTCRGDSGDDNETRLQIVRSINHYLKSSQGSVVDFHLIKDSIDRQCNTLEEEITAQMPIPLYLGLIGTMLGAAVGLILLVMSGGLTAMTSAEGDMLAAGASVSTLLVEIGFAMVASVVGIFLTIKSTMSFKQHKKQHEEGKIKFITWLQVELLPKVSSDLTSPVQDLSKKLHEFSATFDGNLNYLNTIATTMGESISTQREMMEMIEHLDIKRLATFNVKVFQELRDSSERLTAFAEHVRVMTEYTACISDLQVLTELKDYMQTETKAIEVRKSLISQSVDELDTSMRKSFQAIQEHSADLSRQLKDQLNDDNTTYRKIINERQAFFEGFMQRIEETFAKQVVMMQKASEQQAQKHQQALQQLTNMGNIPAELNALTQSIKEQQQSFQKSMLQRLDSLSVGAGGETVGSVTKQGRWQKWLVTAILTVMFVFQMVLFAGFAYFVYDDLTTPETVTDSLPADSAAVGHQ